MEKEKEVVGFLIKKLKIKIKINFFNKFFKMTLFIITQFK
jgi:hypothetical protein